MAQAYAAQRAAVSSLLGEVGSLLSDLLDRTAHSAAEEGQSEDAARLAIDSQLQSFWDVYYKLKGRQDANALSVAVLALTKSGKSTLLNALIGSECMPMNNVPETARIVKIVHDASAASHAEPCLHDGSHTFKGDKAVRARLQELNSQARSHEGGSSSSQSEVPLQLKAQLTALAEYGSGDFGLLHLLDTPGVNEAGEEGLKFQVERLLDSVDAVIYVLDWTKLKTAEEAAMFGRLRSINPTLLSRLSRRLFFVVNKLDAGDVCEGLDPEETRQYVADLVTSQLACDGFRLQPQQVVLLSARNALLARLVLSGRASEDAGRRFARLAFGAAPRSAHLAPSREAVREAALGLLDESGILDLEAKVLSFLYAHSGAVKLLATLDDVMRLLQSVRNVAVSCHACLAKSASELSAEAAGLRGEIQSTLSEFDAVLKTTDAVQAEVVEEVRAHLHALRGRLFTQIVQTLDPDNRIHGSSTGNVTGTSSAASSGRWRRVRDRFLSMFTAMGGSGSGASGSGEGSGGGRHGAHAVPSARSRSKEELLKLLAELHADVMGQIHAEVADFWHILEAVTAGRHAELLRSLNEHLSVLSRKVEGAVSGRLDVVLQPIDISMRLPSAAEFHGDVQSLVAKGIVEKQEKHLRVGERTFDEPQLRFREGVCRWGAYWVDVPRTRTLVEAYNVTVYQLQPHEITQHFIQLVDSAIHSTEAHLSSYVTAFIQQQLRTAKTQIEEYSDRYLGAMSSALETSSRGSEHREAALAQVAGYMARLESLITAAGSMQVEAERHMPHVQDAEPYEDLGCSGYTAEDERSPAVAEEEQSFAETPEAAATAAEQMTSMVAQAALTETAPAQSGALAAMTGAGRGEEDPFADPFAGLLELAAQLPAGSAAPVSFSNALGTAANTATAVATVPVAGADTLPSPFDQPTSTGGAQIGAAASSEAAEEEVRQLAPSPAVSTFAAPAAATTNEEEATLRASQDKQQQLQQCEPCVGHGEPVLSINSAENGSSALAGAGSGASSFCYSLHSCSSDAGNLGSSQNLGSQFLMSYQPTPGATGDATAATAGDEAAPSLTSARSSSSPMDDGAAVSDTVMSVQQATQDKNLPEDKIALEFTSLGQWVMAVPPVTLCDSQGASLTLDEIPAIATSAAAAATGSTQGLAMRPVGAQPPSFAVVPAAAATVAMAGTDDAAVAGAGASSQGGGASGLHLSGLEASGGAEEREQEEAAAVLAQLMMPSLEALSPPSDSPISNNGAPFDYSTGFARAMSSGRHTSRDNLPSPPDEWLLVDGDGSDDEIVEQGRVRA